MSRNAALQHNTGLQLRPWKAIERVAHCRRLALAALLQVALKRILLNPKP